MYETLHSDGKTTGRINYTVWSDVLLCPYCGSEYIFWEVAVDKKARRILREYECPHCGAMVTKRQCERARDVFYDAAIEQEVAHARQVPVLINYSVGKKRYEKVPEQFDLDLIEKINQMAIPTGFPLTVCQKVIIPNNPKDLMVLPMCIILYQAEIYGC